MRRTLSLAEWKFAGAVLGAITSVAGTAAAFANPFHLGLIQDICVTVALVFVLLAAFTGVRLAWKSLRTDQLNQARRLLVPLSRVTDTDPMGIGVDVADGTKQTVLPGSYRPAYLPQYLEREADADLRRAIREAMSGRDKSFVVVRGRSKVGKSRTLFEALAWYDREVAPLQLVAPRCKLEAVESLLEPSESVIAADQPAVLWLDDLEPFLAKGVTFDTLNDWCTGPGRIVAATLGGTAGLDIASDPRIERDLKSLEKDVMRHARRITLGLTNTQEIEVLVDRLSDTDSELVQTHGLAAYLVAGPQLEDKLDTGRPQELAVVEAAIDWARCGRTDPISEAALKKLSQVYLVRAGLRPSRKSFQAGRKWADNPVAGTIALLQYDGETRGYRANQYVVQGGSGRTVAEPPPDQIWDAATETDVRTEAFAVGTAATRNGRYSHAVRAFSRAAVQSSDHAVVARDAEANIRLIVFHTVEYRDPDALKTFVDDYEHESSLRTVVAKALAEQAKTLRALPDRRKDALAAYERFVKLYESDSDTTLPMHPAEALNRQAELVSDLNKPNEAVKIYQDLVNRYENDPAASNWVSDALLGQGNTLFKLARPEEACAVYQRLIKDYPDRGNHTAAAIGLRTIGESFMRSDQPEDAVETYEQLIDRCAENAVVAKPVATALETFVERYRGNSAYGPLVDRATRLIERLGEASCD